MPITRISNLEIPLGKGSDEDLRKALARALEVRIEAVGAPRVVRRSLDARKGRRAPAWTFVVDAELGERPRRLPRGVTVGPPPPPPPPVAPPNCDMEGVRAVVAGTGPAGLFAALSLARRGARVEVLEQGPSMADRVAGVRDLWRDGALNPDANVQFGEGGAGTFSDGKLRTRIKDPRALTVLRTFVEAGAPDAILEEAHPHLGTDGVRRVVQSLRSAAEDLGVSFRFRAPILEAQREGDGWRALTPGDGLLCDLLVLAVGHSARPLFRRLLAMGVPFKAKGFAVGVRVEHPQAWVDARQYGESAGHPDLPPAEYFLTFTDPDTGRGVYSFCMCPGGVVVNSASEPGTLVTNGMSMSHRASGSANAGLVVAVRPQDFGDDPEAGLRFQEDLERRGFDLGGGGFLAPAQSVAAFLARRTDEGPLRTTFRPGVTPAGLRGFFPEWVEGPLERALRRFDRLMPGFAEKGVLLAPETRTSSPMQVVRGEDGCAEGFPGLCLVGEGAGWAGGIVSSAVDALRSLDAFAAKRKGTRGLGD